MKELNAPMSRTSLGFLYAAVLVTSLLVTQSASFAQNSVFIDVHPDYVLRSDGEEEVLTEIFIDDSVHYFYPVRPSAKDPFALGFSIRNWTAGGVNNWGFIFDAPNGEPLHVGTYTDVRRFPSSDDAHPSIRAVGSSPNANAINCSYPNATFTIHEISEVNGRLERLHATFDEECCWEPTCAPDSLERWLWGAPPHILGEVRYSMCHAADLSRDGIVNVSDLAMLLGAFGQTGQHRYSIGNIQNVDVGDLAVLLSQYGRTCEPAGTP